ncbi:peptidyl-prolyl cis-trans isomerase [Paenibacillus agaridevorans]|uniref:Peptidyl-prolyl cis-trans isomerase n=1 Tax=Paenibacillus agaridevorans TaxID=171404 RepID=A0A2R5F0M9_9BACL|nr:peptidylprolyl isomerase [Paenibacillus agaridevorans]GBG11905.1 peptidyl-prolyl cis-trans isomerase [Paenibacillus agaridevorans]
MQFAGLGRAMLLWLFLLLLLAGCGSDNASQLSAQGQDGNAKVMSWSKMPEMSIDLDYDYKALIETSEGSFEILLYADKAPVTVNNFVFLANEGFYEGLKFHSIIESFMIQTGDPLGNGTGTAGYLIPDELDIQSTYKEGVVAMFNSGTPNSGSSQFFICTGPDASNLNRQPNYTIFGEVSSGMDVVQAISRTPVKNGQPVEDVTIVRITIQVS